MTNKSAQDFMSLIKTILASTGARADAVHGLELQNLIETIFREENPNIYSSIEGRTLRAILSNATGIIGIGTTTSSTSTSGTLLFDGGRFTQQLPTVGAGNSSQITGGLNSTTKTLNPTYYVKFKTGSDTTSLRYWFGLYLSAASVSNSDEQSSPFIGFRFSDGVDTGFTPVVDDGSGTAITSDTLGEVLPDTVYTLKIRVINESSMAYFSLNDGDEVSLSISSILDATVFTQISHIMLTASSARHLWFSKMSITHD